ncbi:MAG: SDR family oxidoreductase [Planctomycetota bacterium]
MKNYVVAGGSSGIGFGIVERLVTAGNSVIVLSRTNEKLQTMQGVQHLSIDFSDPECVVGDLPAEIDGVVYAPGSLNLRSFRGLKPDDFRKDFEINIIGAVKLLQAALKGLKAVQQSSVVMFSTVAVEQGMAVHSSIAASKGAVEGLVKSLAAELAPKIRFNCVAPALTDTPLTTRFFSDAEKAAAMGEKYALKRTGTVDDMAEAALFLLGEKSSWITGQVLGVDGGMSSLR